jgi:hypothetical protein
MTHNTCNRGEWRVQQSFIFNPILKSRKPSSICINVQLILEDLCLYVGLLIEKQGKIK